MKDYIKIETDNPSKADYCNQVEKMKVDRQVCEKCWNKGLVYKVRWCEKCQRGMESVLICLECDFCKYCCKCKEKKHEGKEINDLKIKLTYQCKRCAEVVDIGTSVGESRGLCDACVLKEKQRFEEEMKTQRDLDKFGDLVMSLWFLCRAIGQQRMSVSTSIVEKLWSYLEDKGYNMKDTVEFVLKEYEEGGYRNDKC